MQQVRTKRRQYSPSELAEYTEIACPLLSDEIVRWAEKLERPGPDGERQLKECLTLAYYDAAIRLQTELPDDSGAKRLREISKRLIAIYSELQHSLPDDVDAALRVRFGFGVYDKELDHLRFLSEMLLDVSGIWPKSPPPRRGQPSLERHSLGIECLVRAIEVFTGNDFPPPRTIKKPGVHQIELVHQLAGLLIPSLDLANTRTILQHIHARRHQSDPPQPPYPT